MPRLHLIHVAWIQVVFTCIHLYRLSPSIIIVSCFGDKIVVTTTYIHLYALVSGIRIHTDVARPGYLYPATCMWCKRGLSLHVSIVGRNWLHTSPKLPVCAL